MHRIGPDYAALVDGRRMDVDATSLGNQTAHIDRIASRGSYTDDKVGHAGIDQFNALAGGKNDFSARCLDQSFVTCRCSNQIDVASEGRGDPALVHQRPGTDPCELVAIGQKVGVADVERRSDQACYINAGILTEQNTVGIN